VPGIGPVQARILLQHGEPEEIFRTPKHVLEKIEGIGPVRAAAIKKFSEFNLAEDEIRSMESLGVIPLFLTDPGYPKRLLNCYDPPTLLFFKGNADLNASRVIAVIGTRHLTDYGKQVTERLIEDLTPYQVTVISGLAFGIDYIAHRSALRNQLPTVGVLAHGLDQVYPYRHSGLAKEMIEQGGGLLTEFRNRIPPDRHHFPSRNRIVAGMSDAVVVIETDKKGGSMITADLANGYNRDVFAIPGKIDDARSSGCHELIRTQRAQLLTSAEELASAMGWLESKESKSRRTIQQELFIELTEDEKIIVSLLKEAGTIHIDDISLHSRLPGGVMARAMLNLEIQHVIVSLPGKLYRLS